MDGSRLRYLPPAHLECLESNDTGNRLYASEGFRDVARSIHWFVRIP